MGTTKRLLVVVLTAIIMMTLAACGSGTVVAPSEPAAPSAPSTPTDSSSPGGSAPAPAGLQMSPSGEVITATTKTGAPKAAVQKLIYNQVENVSFDPIRVDYADELANHMFEGVTTWVQGKLTLGQAESIDVSADGLTWTITLRDDIFWSDGKPVTAQDFTYNWMRTLNPETAAKYVINLYPIKNAREYNAGEAKAADVGLATPDNRTIIITLTAPTMAFDEMLASKHYAPVRQDIVEAYGDNWALSPATCISNGAFRMKEYKPGEKVIYEKNPNYYEADKVILDEIECRFITDSAVVLMSYEANELLIATRVTSENLLRHVDESFITPNLTNMWLVVNNQDSVLSDARVRRALAMAIDRGAICEAVFKNIEQPAYSLVSMAVIDPATNKPWPETKGHYFAEDVAEAKQLLAEAGYPDGKGFPTLSYGTSSGTEHEEVAQAITAMWKANLGIECTIEVQDSATFIANRKAGAFSVARYMTSSTYNDPMLNLGIYETGELNNDSKYSNPEFDRLKKEANAEPDMVKRSVTLHQMENLLIKEDMGIIPLYNLSQKVMAKPEVVGAGLNPSGDLDFTRAYIAQ